jgi:hypothetical protein
MHPKNAKGLQKTSGEKRDTSKNTKGHTKKTSDGKGDTTKNVKRA